MELRQDEINALATKHGLTSNPIEVGSDGMQSVCLERTVKDDLYCQALLRVSTDGNIYCHTGLYRERCIINNGEVLAVSLEHAVENAASSFDHLVEYDDMSAQMQSAFETKHPESPPGGYFVMYGYEKSADHCETLTAARTRGQKLCDEDPVPAPWSIHDAAGDFIEDIKRTDGLSLESLAQNFNQSHG